MQQGPGLAQDNLEARNWGRPRATQLFMISASPSQLGQGQVAGHGSPLLQKYCWALQVPRNLPPTAWNRQKSWSERRSHCRWRDAEITFFVCVIAIWEAKLWTGGRNCYPAELFCFDAEWILAVCMTTDVSGQEFDACSIDEISFSRLLCWALSLLFAWSASCRAPQALWYNVCQKVNLGNNSKQPTH